jgi:hypothetical protein
MIFQILPSVALLLCLVAEVASFSSEIIDGAPHLKGRRTHYKRDGVKRTLFEHVASNSSIDFVTNSGICETTPGVNQYSGYLSIGRESPLKL